jgi:hypothetical protein
VVVIAVGPGLDASRFAVPVGLYAPEETERLWGGYYGPYLQHISKMLLPFFGSAVRSFPVGAELSLC